MRTKSASYLHILVGCAGSVLLKFVFPVQGTGGQSWFFTGLLLPPFLVMILLGIGLASFPLFLRPIVILVHRGFIALTICAILVLLWLMKGQEGGAGAVVVLVVTIVMIILSLFSVLTLWLLRKTNQIEKPD